MENDLAFVVKQESKAGVIDPHGLDRGSYAVKQCIHAEDADQHSVIVNRHNIGNCRQPAQEMRFIRAYPAGPALRYRFVIPGAVLFVKRIRTGGDS